MAAARRFRAAVFAFWENAEMLYMVVERFRDVEAVYRRFRESGRMAPEGLTYVSSWVDEGLTTCWQVMETEDRRLLEEWLSRWSDLVEFEVSPALTSAEAAARVTAGRHRAIP